MATQSVRIGWRPYVNVVTQVVNAVDADATAFITAAGITNLTQASAINTLVNDLKTYGLWTKMKAVYPMVGGTATSHKFNLKDPRDLDAAFRLVFNGGWIHSSTGAKPNGTTGYADTFLNDFTNLTSGDNHISVYVNTNESNTSAPYTIGIYNPNSNSGLAIRTFGNSDSSARFYNNHYINISNTIGTSTGFWLNTAKSNRFVGFKNSSKIIDTTPSISVANGIISLSCVRWTDIGATQYSSQQQVFASIGDGLTDTEATNFYNSVQKFQTTLGRQIGSPIVSDTDAQAFLNVAGITDLGQANAVNTLVVDLKAAGVWTKMKALYPFVGGTATTHKWNLKDPRDLDAAFRLVFNGGWVHSSMGAKPNGTTGYANTYFNPTVQSLSTTSQHLSYYSRTNIIENAVELGAISSANVNFLGLYVSSTSGTRAGLASSARYNNSAVVDTRGLFIASRTDTSNIKVHVNGSVQASQSVPSTGNDNFSMYIGAYGALTPDLFSTKETAFASIGDGLTDSEASAFYTAVQKYQTTLGRQVGTPVLASGQTAGLLDTYSNAAAAYSLRKLRNGYVGNAIRVRRSSDNAEQDIAFKTDGTLDTTSLLAFVGSGNGFVTTWYDQSGFNNHITQTTAANQPSIVLSGVINTENSKPVILTDGNSFMINSSVSWNLTTNSIFATIKLNASRGAMAMMSSVGTSNQHFVSRNTNGTGRYYDSAGQEITAAALPNGFNLISIHENSSGVTVFENGANLVTNFAHDIGGTVTGVVIFKRDAGNGLTSGSGFSELIIYGSTSQLSNNSAINTNINSHYSIY